MPQTMAVPSTLHESVKTSPRPSSLAIEALLRVSQKRTVPSLAQLASSNSLVGLNRTFSTPEVWPLSSIWLLGVVRSGFQMRMLLSDAPVAICEPVAFHEIERCLEVSEHPDIVMKN